MSKTTVVLSSCAAYSVFERLEVTRIEPIDARRNEHLLVLKSTVHATMRSDVYEGHIFVSPQLGIVYGHCVCVAGASACHHQPSLLSALEVEAVNPASELWHCLLAAFRSSIGVDAGDIDWVSVSAIARHILGPLDDTLILRWCRSWRRARHWLVCGASRQNAKSDRCTGATCSCSRHWRARSADNLGLAMTAMCARIT